MLAGTTPDRGGGNPGDAPVISVTTPHAEEVFSPKVAQALAADPAYQSLNADRAKASGAADAAQHQLDTLQAQMKTAPAGIQQQNLQIQISNTTQQLEAAKSAVRTDDIKKDDIQQHYKTLYGDPIILPAAAPAAKPGTQTESQAGSAPAGASGSK